MEERSKKNMKKIAIMTWWHHANYGTALQAVALTQIIKRLGYDVSVINYIPHGKVVGEETFTSVMRYAFQKLKIFLNIAYVNKERNQEFKKFLNQYLRFTEECQTASDLFQLNTVFDAFVCGSDQIWAPSGFNSKYFLDFTDKNKKVAYAPSIGVSAITDKYISNRMKELISEFKYLSVRESQGKEIIADLCNKSAELVLDPTLLLEKDEWLQLLEFDLEACTEKYMLCYFLGQSSTYWNYVEKIAKKKNFKVKIIPMHKKDLKKGECVNEGDPREFVKLIANAEYICTDSFHGVLFSIIFNRPFSVFERFSKNEKGSQNSRIYNILAILNLNSRLVNVKDFVEEDIDNIDYSMVNDLLKIERQKSLNFLDNALKHTTNCIFEKSIEQVTNTCCGCGACQEICPQKAIAIKKDNSGFYQSFVDNTKCVGCGVCRKVCAFYGDKGESISQTTDLLYGAKSSSQEVLKLSSSGGIAYELSKYLMNEGYDVFGCAYDYIANEAKHIKITQQNNKLNELCGSKYVQSNMVQIFHELMQSNKGLFIGTPCQAAAVDKFLRFNGIRENFIIADLICHGVPSYNMYHKYLSYIKETQCMQELSVIYFRWKKKGWREKNIYIQDFITGNTYIKEQHKDLFYKFFLLGHCYMKTCFECNYRSNTAADLRLGDFWGPRYRTDKTGVSMVVAHTEKGKDLLNSLQQEGVVRLEQQSVADYFKFQDCNNPIFPIFYTELQNDLANAQLDIINIAKKYCHRYFVWKSRLWEIKDVVKRMLGLNR